MLFETETTRREEQQAEHHLPPQLGQETPQMWEMLPHLQPSDTRCCPKYSGLQKGFYAWLFFFFSSQLQIPLTNKSCSLAFQPHLVYLLRLSYSLQKFCKVCWQYNITQPLPSTAHQCGQMLVGSPVPSQAVGWCRGPWE